jgi:hypothetical protein
MFSLVMILQHLYAKTRESAVSKQQFCDELFSQMAIVWVKRQLLHAVVFRQNVHNKYSDRKHFVRTPKSTLIYVYGLHRRNLSSLRSLTLRGALSSLLLLLLLLLFFTVH